MQDYVPPQSVISAGQSSVGSLFHSRVAVNPEHPAVIEAGKSISYTELENRTNRLANYLIESGLQHGDRVAMLARNCTEYVEVELAAAKAGLIVAALNWRLSDRELAHCASLVEPKLIICQQEFSENLEGLDLPEHQSVSIGKNYEDCLAASSDLYPGLPVDPEDGLVILYTSGTTGLPKGALISHRAMIARGACFASEMQIPVADNFVAWAPFYHMASTDQSIAILLRGGTVHIVDGYQPDVLIDLIETVPMRYFVLLPGTVGEFAAAVEARKARIKKIELCGAMADLVPREDIAAATRALNAPYLNTFGSTETGLPPATGATIPVGVVPDNLSKRQSAFCEVRLVDNNDREVAIGEPGEVAVRGPTVFSGYWNADATNREDFRGGWFHMGDVMRRNEDGSLDYVDRVKYMIKSGGENIYPAEIEQVVLEDSRVSEAVVVRKSDPKWSEVPVVFVVKADPDLNKAEILHACKQNLASFKQPKDIIFIEASELPRSTTGKVQRHELEARLLK
ncbi:MAG: AMP-binding protein [Gammaproteobacteria bacterium]|nr:AMP-binding protein [Gammaproteobacteria bacterium]